MFFYFFISSSFAPISIDGLLFSVCWLDWKLFRSSIKLFLLVLLLLLEKDIREFGITVEELWIAEFAYDIQIPGLLAFKAGLSKLSLLLLKLLLILFLLLLLYPEYSMESHRPLSSKLLLYLLILSAFVFWKWAPRMLVIISLYFWFFKHCSRFFCRYMLLYKSYFMLLETLIFGSVFLSFFSCVSSFSLYFI